MIEKHPYKPLIPQNARYLILGSFPAKQKERGDWYYVNPRNQFWSILEKVYNTNLSNKTKKQNLLKKLKIAISDIIRSCEREKKINSDNNLTNITYNTILIENILKKENIKKIYLTSRFVERKFKKLMNNLVCNSPEMELIYLPSPSPRYVSISLLDKVKIYKQLLPHL